MTARSKPIALAIIVIAAAAGITFAVLLRDSTQPGSSAAKPDDRPASAAFAPTVANDAVPRDAAPAGMVWIPGGEFSMGAVDPLGSDANIVGMQATHDSRPIHRVYVDAFWMDSTEVTNAQFEAFVTATGFITVAERTPRAEDFPGAPPAED